MSKPLILVWVEKAKIKGAWGPTFIAYTMAQDGSPLGQMSVPNVEWAKANLGVTTTTRHDKYADEYPLGFEVVWLEDPEQDPRWWRAKFFNDNLWEISFAYDGLPFVEFRDERTRRVCGYVVHVVGLEKHYVVPGRTSPRSTDIFPEPGMTFREAMIEANLQFCASKE